MLVTSFDSQFFKAGEMRLNRCHFTSWIDSSMIFLYFNFKLVFKMVEALLIILIYFQILLIILLLIIFLHLFQFLIIKV